MFKPRLAGPSCPSLAGIEGSAGRVRLFRFDPIWRRTARRAAAAGVIGVLVVAVVAVGAAVLPHGSEALSPGAMLSFGPDVPRAYRAGRSCDDLTHGRAVVFPGRDRGTVCVVGLIDQETARTFAATDRRSDRFVVLRSAGGDVLAAIRMATMIHAMGQSVIVDGVCASSCANYPFMAGARKYVFPGGFVGFHGGPAAGHFTYHGPARFRDQAARQDLGYVRTLQDAQSALYRTLGVDESIMYRMPAALARRRPDLRRLFWTYDADALVRRFGVGGLAFYATPDDRPLLARLLSPLVGVRCSRLDQAAWVCRFGLLDGLFGPVRSERRS